MKRWGQFGARGKLLMGNATSVEATGKYEVTLKLSAPNGAWKNLIADVKGGLAIYPEEIVSKAGNQPIEQKDYIGTGPYKFKEWRPNRYVEVEKFDGYNSRKDAGDGFAGARVANFDAIRFVPVPDVGTRVSGVQAGDYDYAEMISGDLYDTLSADKSIHVVRSNAPLFGLFFMNSKEGILKDNYKLRRAIQMALEKIAGATRLLRPQGLVGCARLDLSAGQQLVFDRGHRGLQPARCKEGERACQGGRLHRHADPLAGFDQLSGPL